MLFRKKRKETAQRIVVTGENALADRGGYNRLRDNVLFMNADGNTKVIQIESSVAHEGKTTVACNLAVSLGKAGKKCVVMELDFYRPRAHRIFKADGAEGIAEYMLGACTKEQIIKSTDYENTYLITRGADIDNPPLVYLSEKFKNLIAELREEFDYVILDCAPVLQSSDYINISKVSDGALFLVAHSQTTKGQVEDAVKELRKNDVPILGTLFTMYNPKKSLDYNKVYSYYGEKDAD